MRTKEVIPTTTEEKNVPREVRILRPAKARLSPEESLRRMESFDERKEQIIAAVRKSAG